MKLKIPIEKFNYLKSNLRLEGNDLLKNVTISNIGNFYFLELTEMLADKIRDWATEKLQKVGFDKEYNLTSEGQILEDLIDLFYV